MFKKCANYYNKSCAWVMRSNFDSYSRKYFDFQKTRSFLQNSFTHCILTILIMFLLVSCNDSKGYAIQACSTGTGYAPCNSSFAPSGCPVTCDQYWCTCGSCITFSGESLRSSTTNVPLISSPEVNWINTGLNASNGKAVNISVLVGGIYQQTQKYLMIVKLDPRFSQPVMYIAQYVPPAAPSAQGKYVADWTNMNPATSSAALTNNLSQLVAYSARNGIAVNAGDAVNMEIITSSEFYNYITSGMATPYYIYDINNNRISSDFGATSGIIDLSTYITTSGGLDNSLIYSNSIEGACNGAAVCMSGTTYNLQGNQAVISAVWAGVNVFGNLSGNAQCAALTPSMSQTSIAPAPACIDPPGTSPGLNYAICPPTSSITPIYNNVCGLGQPMYSVGEYNVASGNKNIVTEAGMCANGYNPIYNQAYNPKPPCQYTHGLGLQINVNGAVVKDFNDPFLNNGSNYVYYFLSNSNGYINFQSLYSMSGLFANSEGGVFNNKISNYTTGYSSSAGILNLLANYSPQLFIGGRYLFAVEIGSSTGEVLQKKISTVQYMYQVVSTDGKSTILDQGTISPDTAGDYVIKFNASGDGALYVGVLDPYDDLAGNAVFMSQTYNGSNSTSSFLYNNLVIPLKENLLYVSSILYGQITQDGNFINLVSAALVLYLFFYGVVFALGSTKITVQDIVSRVIKILVVSTLFSTTSWSFFNEYLFTFFLNSVDEMMNIVTAATSTVGNPFGFIDPIIDKYTSSDLWSIIGIYIQNFPYGYVIPAVLVMVGIMYFMKAILEVFIGYLMAFTCMCVLISLAPLFITAILFERTKQLFDNWINMMFSFVLQPTFVLIFVLFLDQVTSAMLASGLKPVCYDPSWWPIELNLGIFGSYTIYTVAAYAPYPLSTPVAQLIGVSALFFLLMKLAKEIVKLSNSVVDMIAMAGSQQGPIKSSGMTDMTESFLKYDVPAIQGSIKEYMVRPVMKRVKKVASYKRKKDDSNSESTTAMQTDIQDKGAMAEGEKTKSPTSLGTFNTKSLHDTTDSKIADPNVHTADGDQVVASSKIAPDVHITGKGSTSVTQQGNGGSGGTEPTP